jgi:hypothetical protein
MCENRNLLFEIVSLASKLSSMPLACPCVNSIFKKKESVLKYCQESSLHMPLACPCANSILKKESVLKYCQESSLHIANGNIFSP